jgi:hypothetical protein
MLDVFLRKVDRLMISAMISSVVSEAAADHFVIFVTQDVREGQRPQWFEAVPRPSFSVALQVGVVAPSFPRVYRSIWLRSDASRSEY